MKKIAWYPRIFNARNLKATAYYYLRRIRTDRRAIQILLNAEPEISLCKDTNIFYINNTRIPWETRLNIRKSIRLNLRNAVPKTTLKLGKLNTGYFDQCLQRYIVERLELQLNNPETCWKRFASNNWCSFWSDPVIEFNEPEKRKVIEKFNNYHQTRSGKKHLISYEVEGSLLRRDENGFVFITSDSTTNESKVLDMNSDDKVLKLVSSIQEFGFSNRLSSLNPIILGYSTKDNYFQVLSGRHRIASLLYLAKIGKVSEDLEIVCHQVHYDFDSLSLSRPFIKHCKECVANNFVFTDG